MSFLPQVFNPLDHDPTQSGGQLPVGAKQLVCMQSAEGKVSNDGQSQHLLATLRLLEGPMAGKTAPWRLNLVHPNNITVEIAHRHLSAVAHCVGHVQPFQDVSVLFERPFRVDVEAQVEKPQYTQVTKIYDAAGNEPRRGQMPSGVQPQAGFGQQQQAQPMPTQQPQTAQEGFQGQPPAQAGWGGQQPQPEPNQGQQAQPQVQQVPPQGWGGQQVANGQQAQPQPQPQPQQQAAQGVTAGWAGQQAQGGGSTGPWANQAR